MTRLLLASALLLVACGARTELDPFTTDGGAPSDVPHVDIPAPGPGVTIGLFSGNTARDGTNWGRPYNCENDDNGQSHAYSVVTFENPTSQDLRVEILVDWTFDGYLHVYSNPFDPSQPGARCLASNDDFNGTRQSRADGIVVPAGGAIDLVLSSFSSGSTGDYDVFVITQ